MSHKTETLQPLAVGTCGAGKLLDISERSVAELVAKNAIPSFKIGGRRLFSIKALDAWIDAMNASTVPTEEVTNE